MTLKASDYEGSVSLSPEDERIGRYLRGETLLLGTGGSEPERKAGSWSVWISMHSAGENL